MESSTGTERRHKPRGPTRRTLFTCCGTEGLRDDKTTIAKVGANVPSWEQFDECDRRYLTVVAPLSLWCLA